MSYVRKKVPNYPFTDLFFLVLSPLTQKIGVAATW